jgi:hypothetical protein
VQSSAARTLRGPAVKSLADIALGPMNERRYTNAEVRRIIELATSQALARPRSESAEGLTLPEVQSIGSEVGVDPAAVARAAATLDAGLGTPLRRSLGMPIEVGRVIPLPRAPTDEEWDRLVTELRTTFRAQGRVSVQGGLREWRNGNLHASVEPAAGGYRLRLGTVKGDAQGLNALGATGLLAGAAVFVSMMLSGEIAGAVFVPAIFGTAGISAFLANMIRLPRWADQRTDQMDHIIERAHTIVTESKVEPTD